MNNLPGQLEFSFLSNTNGLKGDHISPRWICMVDFFFHVQNKEEHFHTVAFVNVYFYQLRNKNVGTCNAWVSRPSNSPLLWILIGGKKGAS